MKYLIFAILSLSFAIIAQAQELPPENGSTNDDPASHFNNGLGSGIGFVIGEKIGQEIANQMSTVDRRTYLNTQRDMLRAKLLKKYILSDRTAAIHGSMQSLREGHDANNNRCVEYEVDIIIGISRDYFVNTACLIGQNWILTDPRAVIFSQPGSHGPDLPGQGSGGWLPHP